MGLADCPLVAPAIVAKTIGIWRNQLSRIRRQNRAVVTLNPMAAFARSRSKPAVPDSPTFLPFVDQPCGSVQLQNATVYLCPNNALRPGREYMAVHARQLAFQPGLHIPRKHHRPLLRSLEQAHRSTVAHHDHRAPQMGPWVVINAAWYYATERGGDHAKAGYGGSERPQPASEK